eukprot:scaffold647525_cov51-Attheya_sp.AAC.1
MTLMQVGKYFSTTVAAIVSTKECLVEEAVYNLGLNVNGSEAISALDQVGNLFGRGCLTRRIMSRHETEKLRIPHKIFHE